MQRAAGKPTAGVAVEAGRGRAAREDSAGAEGRLWERTGSEDSLGGAEAQTTPGER